MDIGSIGGKNGIFDQLRELGITQEHQLFRIFEEIKQGKKSTVHDLVRASLKRGKKSIANKNKRDAQETNRKMPGHLVKTNTNLTHDDYKNAQLADMDRTRMGQGMETAMVCVENYNPKDPKGLFLFGAPGIGKSRLMKGLVLKWAERGCTGEFWQVAELAKEMRNWETGDALMKKLAEIDVLVLDDFGTENTTDFVKTELIMLFDQRAARKKGIHFTSNIGADRVRIIYGSRIADRLNGVAQGLQCSGKTFRV
jgi:DNA replication protein DnaC